MEQPNRQNVNDEFFRKIEKDPNLQSLFKTIEFDRYKHHPDTFYSHAFKEGSHTEEEIKNAHTHLSINDGQFDSMIDHFINSLEQSDDREKAKQMLEQYRDHITRK